LSTLSALPMCWLFYWNMKCFHDTSHPKSDQQNMWNYMQTHFKNTFINRPFSTSLCVWCRPHRLHMHSSSISCTDPQKGDILLSCGQQCCWSFDGCLDSNKLPPFISMN
jgi:hypothetical protein